MSEWVFHNNGQLNENDGNKNETTKKRRRKIPDNEINVWRTQGHNSWDTNLMYETCLWQLIGWFKYLHSEKKSLLIKQNR